MKELYLRAERHFVCEGGSISCLFSFYPTPQIMSLLIEWDRTWLDVGLIVCVLVCRDLMEFSNRRCLFSMLTRGASWDIGLIWESNKQDQMFVRVDVWQESRWICKHSRQTRRWISKLLENGLLLSSARVTFLKIISVCALIWKCVLPHAEGSCMRNKAMCSLTLCVSKSVWIHLPRQGRLFLRNGWNEAGRGLLSRNEVDRQHHGTEW